MTLSRARSLLPAVPPLLLAALVVKLWLTRTLGYYVNGRTIWIVLLGGLLFAVVGVVAAIRSWRAEQHGRAATRGGPYEGGPYGGGSCEEGRHEGESLEKGFPWRALVFLLPVLVGLLVPAHPLSATSGQASSLGALQLASHVSGGSPGDDFSTWISALSDHPDPTWWAGQHVTLVGFVAHQSGLPARSFIVGRYLVTCCVVDATLLGFPVQIDRGSIPPQGAWVQVSGVFGRDYWVDPTGSHYPLIQHARLSPVTIPSSPYLSP